MLKNRLLQLFKDNAGKGYGLRSEASGDVPAIYLYDAIGEWYGVTARDFARELNSIKADTVDLFIDSPGGDVFDARAIATTIQRSGKTVNAKIDGVCASAATTVALACSSAEMAAGTRFMIHNAWTLGIGNAAEFRSLAALLDGVDDDIAADYIAKTGKTMEDIKSMMAAETWMSAQEALNAKFVDSIFDGRTKNAMRWDLSAYDNAPKDMDPQEEEPTVYDRDRYERRLFLVENAR